MKKLILLFVMIFLFSTICIAEEILGIQRENWHLTINEDTIMVSILFMIVFFPLIIMLIIIFLAIPKIILEFITTYKMAPIDILKKRLSQGEITYEEFISMKKELEESKLDIKTQQTYSKPKQSIIRAIPEKCS